MFKFIAGMWFVCLLLWGLALVVPAPQQRAAATPQATGRGVLTPSAEQDRQLMEKIKLRAPTAKDIADSHERVRAAKARYCQALDNIASPQARACWDEFHNL